MCVQISPCDRYPMEHRQRAQQKPPEDRHRVAPGNQQLSQITNSPLLVTKRVQLREIHKLYLVLL